MVRRLTVPLITTTGIAVLSLVFARTAQATSVNCVGVGIAAPANSSVLDVNHGGQPACVMAPNGAVSLNGTMYAGSDLGTPSGVTSYNYQAVEQLITDTDTQGPTSYTYDAESRLVQDTDGSFSTFYKYDSQDRLIETRNFNGASMVNDVTYNYDALNRLVSDSNGSQTISYVYDASGLLITQSDGTFTTHYTYDAQNRLTEVDTTIGATTLTTRYMYDATGNLHQVQDPAGSVSTYQYDAVGNLIKVIDGLGNVTNFTYDGKNQLVSDAQTTAQTRMIYAAPQAVPEPATILLTGFGVAGLLGRRRLRRKTA